MSDARHEHEPLDSSEVDSDELDSGEFDGAWNESSDEERAEVDDKSRTQRRWGGTPRRPGEQDPFQSPLVMWLFGGVVLLALAASVLWTVLQRYQRSQAYEAARTEYEAKRYRQAVDWYEAFLDEYPSGELAQTARREVARARVLKEIDTATPAWEAGLGELEALIAEFRETEAFDAMKAPVFEDARTIAFGSARDAERTESAEPLVVFDRARPVVLQYSPAGEVEEVRRSLVAARTAAERAVLRRSTYETTIAEVDAHLAAGEPLAALDARLDLLDEYAEYRDDADLAERFEKALEAERSRLVVDANARDAETEERADEAIPAVTIVHSERNRGDRTAGEGGEIVLARAGGTCFGLDGTTGRPRWRRPLGVDQPFFPVEMHADLPKFLAFDGHDGELQMLDADSGESIWRQAIAGRPSGAPLDVAGTLYVSTDAGELVQIDRETGRLLARAVCPQRLVAPPVRAAGRVAVLGERSVLYVFSTAPLAVEDVVYLGHRRGAAAGLWQAPQLEGIGPYVLFVENDRVDSARLRLFDGALAGDPPETVAEARVAGNVVDSLAVRGRWLFVPFGRERIATFTLSAEAGQPPLVEGPKMGTPGADVPVSILPGPAEEFWTASTALRRQQILLDAIKRTGEAALGRHVQPLRSIGDRLFVGYERSGRRAISFEELDRRTFEVGWRTELADVPSLQASSDGRTLFAATTSGRIPSLPVDDFGITSFIETGSPLVPLSAESDRVPLVVPTAAGFLYVGHGDDGSVRAWSVDAGTRSVAGEFALPGWPTVPPVAIGEDVAVAVPGRISLLRASGDAVHYDSPVEDADWLALAVVGPNVLLAQNDAGGLARLEIRSQPVPHIAVTATTRDLPASVPVAASSDVVALVGKGNELVLLSPDRFERLATRPLGTAAIRAPSVVGDRVLVETRDGRLLALPVGDAAGPPWSVNLEGDSLAGPPLRTADEIVVATRGGNVLGIDPRAGTVNRTIRLRCDLAGGPIEAGGALFVAARDGSILRVPSPDGKVEEDRP